MFADSLSHSPWGNRSHRGLTTLASFALQALAIAGLLALPYFYTEGLPHLQAIVPESPILMPPPAPAPPPRLRSAAAPVSNVLSSGELMQPRSIPRTISALTETVPPPPVDADQLGVAGGTGDRAVANAVWGARGRNMAVLAPPPVAQHPLVSRMMQGNLVYRVQPVYPPLARAAGVQGTVVLRAIISRQGTIANLQVVSGHPMLAPAAVEAVRQWRYRPYLLNNEPIEVETQITVNFVLSGG